jgi:hypothetical protein
MAIGAGTQLNETNKYLKHYANELWGDTPRYKSREFVERFLPAFGKTLDEYRETAKYKHLVEIGAIVNDEWNII